MREKGGREGRGEGGEGGRRGGREEERERRERKGKATEISASHTVILPEDVNILLPFLGNTLHPERGEGEGRRNGRIQTCIAAHCMHMCTHTVRVYEITCA